jgi:hypothetical protein
LFVEALEEKELRRLNRKHELTQMQQDSHLAVGHAVEIIGKVDQNLHVKVQAVTDFGTNIGMCSLSTSLGSEGDTQVRRKANVVLIQEQISMRQTQ